MLKNNSIDSSQVRIEKVLVARIDPGEDLQKSFETIAERERISAGVILSVVGSLGKAKLRNLKSYPTRHPISDADRLYEEVNGPLEILNVTGNICRTTDNEIHVHAHIILSKAVDGKIVLLGGHLTEGSETFVMVEAFIGVLEKGGFTRSMHSERKAWEISFHRRGKAKK